VNGGILNTTLW